MSLESNPLIQSSHSQLNTINWEINSRTKSIAKNALIAGVVVAALGGIASLTIMGFPMHGLGAIGSYMVIGGAGVALMGLIGMAIGKGLEAKEKKAAKQALKEELTKEDEGLGAQMGTLKDKRQLSFKREIKLNGKTYTMEVFKDTATISNRKADKAPKNLHDWSFSNKGMDIGKKALIGAVALLAVGLIASFGAGGFPIHGLGAFGGMMITGGAGIGVLGVAVYTVSKIVAKVQENKAKKALEEELKEFQETESAKYKEEVGTLYAEDQTSFRRELKVGKKTYYVEAFQVEATGLFTFNQPHLRITNRK